MPHVHVSAGIMYITDVNLLRIRRASRDVYYIGDWDSDNTTLGHHDLYFTIEYNTFFTFFIYYFKLLRYTVYC